MGDVFDAMNRAKRDRGEQPQSNEITGFPAAPNTPTPQPGGDTHPALPIDEVRDPPNAPLHGEPPETSLKRPEEDLPQPSITDPMDADSVDVDVPLTADQSEDNGHDASLNGYSAKIVVHHDRGSAITEQYRAIRTQILARSRNRRLQTHVITSSVPGEGKSVTTANLGVSFSELRNQQTLLIEADLRRPSFQMLFDRECTPGLLQLLRGDITDIDQAIHQTVYDNLQFMPAGGRDPTHSTELLSSPRMAQILDRLKDHYDHIFIDTPPVVTVTDAAILAGLCDQTMMVVRLHKTPVDMVDRAKRLLHANNCNVSGVILTHLYMYLPRYVYRYGSTYT